MLDPDIESTFSTSVLIMFWSAGTAMSISVHSCVSFRTRAISIINILLLLLLLLLLLYINNIEDMALYLFFSSLKLKI